MCLCVSWNQACSAAVAVAGVPGNSALIKENPWNSSWSRFWITSSSGGVSTGGWRVKKRSKFSASRPHCWGGRGRAVNMGEGWFGEERVGMERNERIGVGLGGREGKQKKGNGGLNQGVRWHHLNIVSNIRTSVRTRGALDSPLQKRHPQETTNQGHLRFLLLFFKYLKHIQLHFKTEQGHWSLKHPVAVHYAELAAATHGTAEAG